MDLQWYFWIGLIAAVCISVFTMPQLIQVIKTKHTEGLSVVMLCLLELGDICFTINGIGILTDTDPSHFASVGLRLSSGLPLFLANAIALIITTALLLIKLNHMRLAKKHGVSEKQFCDNYKSYKAKR